MHILIDGYNLLLTQFSEAVSKGGLEIAREGLLKDLARLAANKHMQITVVFDSRCGSNCDKQHPPLSIIYAKSADDYIRTELRDGLKCSVVTNDREILATVLACKCKPISTKELTEMMGLVRIAKPAESATKPEEKPIRVESVDKEAELFGLKPNDTVNLVYKKKRKK